MSTAQKTTVTEINSEAIINPVNSKADIENFYRFVFENSLRRETKLALTEIHKVLKPKKSRRGRKKGSKNKVQ
jgi:hypothetical protein